MGKNHFLLILAICLFSIGLACIVIAGYALADFNGSNAFGSEVYIAKYSAPGHSKELKIKLQIDELKSKGKNRAL